MPQEDRPICGLVGVIGNVSYKDKQVFETLLILDVLRGPHSTGVAVIEKDKDITVVKKLGTPHNLFDTKSYDKAMAPYNVKGLIGHNRYATKGAINEKNAHPFMIGDVVGCHNGTLTATYNLPDYKDFDVDSENIMHAINEESIVEVLPELRGAYALTVYDKREDTFYLARNEARPMSYCWSEKKDKLYYASEEWMLRIALQRNDIKVEEFFQVPAGQLYQFKFDKNDVRLVIRKFTPYTAPPVVKHQQHGGSNVSQLPAPKKDSRFQAGKEIEFEVERIGGFPNGRRYIIARSLVGDKEVHIYLKEGGFEWTSMTESVNTFTAEVQSYVNAGVYDYVLVKESTIKEKIEKEDDLDLGDPILTDWKGKEITRKAWEHHTRHGCANCRRDVSEEEGNQLVWFSIDQFACPDCIDLDIVKSMAH